MNGSPNRKRFDPEMWVENKRDEFEEWIKNIFRPGSVDERPQGSHQEKFKNSNSVFKVKQDEIDELFRFRADWNKRNKAIIFLIGVALTGITLMGVLLGYIRAYNRFMRPKREYPVFYPLKPIVKFAMYLGGFLAATIGLILWFSGKFIITEVFSAEYGYKAVFWISVNTIASIAVFVVFRYWQVGMSNMMVESNKFGSARFAEDEDLNEYCDKEGLYIGSKYVFEDKGHLLTVAGTRGGKGTNLIIPNLLGKGNYKGSWVVIDPKGENAAITARYQRQMGKNVVVLNPWDLLAKETGEAQSYNPLDILSDVSSIHLVDDAQIIAEMLVPIQKEDQNKFFTDNARSIIAGLIMHLATTEDAAGRTLTTLWRWVRYSGDDWDGLIAKMRRNPDPVNGFVIRTIGNEIVKLMEAGEETFGSIISNVLQSTDFLKSPALQRSLESGYDPRTLADGNTALYIIIPADKLKSHSRWLRLVVTTTLRAVIRKPDKRVCFLLDEFAALGYLSEIETALSTYAGYELTIWPILQSLIQLKGQYGDNWETFVANSAVRQFFSINDNFSAEYVSQSIGMTSNVIIKKSWYGVEDAEANQRSLVTPDEVRRGSAENIFAFFGSKPVAVFGKKPYYEMEALKERADPNPYIVGRGKAEQESATKEGEPGGGDN